MSVRVRVAAASLFWAAAALPAGAAEPLPTPATDFALKATMRDGGTLELMRMGERARMELMAKSAPGMVIGLLDTSAAKMVLMVPSMPKMAVQIELPPAYNFAALSGTGTKTGTAEVAGEACDIWKIESTTNAKAGTGPTTACITADGIALRTEMEIKGKPEVIYEATAVTRGPQEPQKFLLPSGVQTLSLPKSAVAALPGLAPFVAGTAGQ
ncbi:hypothetical protein ACLBXM_12095 [Xanthobacteraceae bacterium A53D]